MAKKSKKNNPGLSSHTVSLLVPNRPGVLMRIALMFTKRGFNIDSLTVSPSVDPRFSRMTIAVQSDPSTLEQIIKQSAKLIDVIHVREHTPAESIVKELALFKVRIKPSTKAGIQKLMRSLRAKAVDTTNEMRIIEVAGTTEELDDFEKRLKKYGIIEMIRTGKLVMTKGKELT